MSFFFRRAKKWWFHYWHLFIEFKYMLISIFSDFCVVYAESADDECSRCFFFFARRIFRFVIYFFYKIKSNQTTTQTAIKIKKNKDNVKFKVRCSRFLYTLVVEDNDKAQRLRQSLPSGKHPNFCLCLR